MFTYVLNSAGDGYVLTKVSDTTLEKVVIPDTYNSLPVKEIRFTFINFTNLKELVIGNNVEKTYFDTFNCESLEKIYFGKAINTISGSFTSCANLTDIYYYGTEENWENMNFVSIDESFENFTKARMHFGILGESVMLTYEDKTLFPYTHWNCVKGKPENISAEKITYHNGVSGLKSQNVKDALDELNAKSYDASYIESWEGLKYLVRSGRASEFIKIGDRFSCMRNDKELVWIVIGIDVDIPAQEGFRHSLTLQLDECISNIPFSMPEASSYTIRNLQPGDYYTTLTNYADTPDYVAFTFENELAPYSLIRISEGKVYVYGQDEEIVYTTDVTMVSKNQSDMTGINLLSSNYRIHSDMGNLNYQKSDIRQWLNSDKTDWWERQSNYSLAPKDYMSVAGFMNGLDEDFLSAVNPVKKTTVLPDGTTVETADKFFIISSEEVYVEGTNHYPYFKDNSTWQKPNFEADAIRIKNYTGSPRHWWLRNAAPGDSGYLRVLTDGGVGTVSSAKVHAFGVVPTCAIC